jgi:hypothetical protein
LVAEPESNYLLGFFNNGEDGGEQEFWKATTEVPTKTSFHPAVDAVPALIKEAQDGRWKGSGTILRDASEMHISNRLQRLAKQNSSEAKCYHSLIYLN